MLDFTTDLTSHQQSENIFRITEKHKISSLRDGARSIWVSSQVTMVYWYNSGPSVPFGLNKCVLFWQSVVCPTVASIVYSIEWWEIHYQVINLAVWTTPSLPRYFINKYYNPIIVGPTVIITNLLYVSYTQLYHTHLCRPQWWEIV